MAKSWQLHGKRMATAWQTHGNRNAAHPPQVPRRPARWQPHGKRINKI